VTIFNSVKSSSSKPKWAVMVLVICFAAVALLGSPLHDHDLDSSHVDLDCISCHLVHSNIGLEHDEPNLFAATQENRVASIATTRISSHAKLSVSSRAPPVICWFVLLTNTKKHAGPWNRCAFSSLSKWVHIPSSALENYEMRKREFCVT